MMATGGQQQIQRGGQEVGPPIKSEQAKKGEAIKEIHQFKIKLQNMEREKAAHLYQKRGDFHKDFSTLQEMEQTMNDERKTEKTRMQQQMSRVKTMVRKFHRELQDVKPTPEFVEKLKVIMEEIEGHIADIKEKQRQQYEDLLRDERVTDQEVTQLNRRFDSWAQLGPAALPDASKSKALPSHRESSRDLPPEVKEFERFEAQSGGPKGGWDEYDHGTFLKYRNRHKGKITFLQDVMGGALPTKTDVEIRQHEEWFQRYLRLNEEKKEAIAKWRDRKEIEKDEILAKAAEQGEEEEAKLERLQKERERLFDQEKHEQRSQLNKWKVERELERAESQQRQLQQQISKAKQEEERRYRQIDNKKKVELYRRQQDAQERERQQEEALREQVEQEEKQKMAKVLISKYSSRDLSAAKDRRAKELAKQQQTEQEKQERLQRIKRQVEVNVTRDPSRLLKPTAGWVERNKDPGPTGGGQVLHMPHRATPGWRQGLN